MYSARTTCTHSATATHTIITHTHSHTIATQFDNCLVYTDAEGFSGALLHALRHEPTPMDEITLR